MLVMVVFFIAFRWIHLSTPLIRLFMLVLILFWMPTLNFFFFSSRRRHTRFDCDWSSDVCSSDLGAQLGSPPAAGLRLAVATGQRRLGRGGVAIGAGERQAVDHAGHEIGRASCRERV